MSAEKTLDIVIDLFWKYSGTAVIRSMAFNGQLNVVQAVKQLESKDASIFASGVMTYPYRLLIIGQWTIFKLNLVLTS